MLTLLCYSAFNLNKSAAIDRELLNKAHLLLRPLMLRRSDTERDLELIEVIFCARIAPQSEGGH